MLNNFQSNEKIGTDIFTGEMIYYIAYYEESAVGYCAIKLEQKMIFLSKLYIKKDFRKQGIGKEMLQNIIYSFEDKEYIYLTVNKHNTGSIAAYESMGFTITGSVVNDIGNGYFMDDYVMTLSIN